MEANQIQLSFQSDKSKQDLNTFTLSSSLNICDFLCTEGNKHAKGDKELKAPLAPQNVNFLGKSSFVSNNFRANSAFNSLTNGKEQATGSAALFTSSLLKNSSPQLTSLKHYQAQDNYRALKNVKAKSINAGLHRKKIQELFYKSADQDKCLRSSDLCANTVCSYAQEFIGVDGDDSIILARLNRTCSLLSFDFPATICNSEETGSINECFLKPTNEALQNEKLFTSQNTNSLLVNPFILDETNNLRNQIKGKILINMLIDSFCKVERYENEYLQTSQNVGSTRNLNTGFNPFRDYSDVVDMIVDLMHVNDHLKRVLEDLHSLSFFITHSKNEGTEMSKTEKQIVEGVLKKIIEILYQKYCVTAFSRFSFLKHHSHRIHYLRTIYANFAYQKIPKVAYSKQKRASWVPLCDATLDEWETPNFRINIKDKSLGTKDDIDYLCTAVEKYESIGALANSLFMKITQIVTQAYQVYSLIAKTAADFSASVTTSVKSTIDTIFQIITISVTLQNDEILLSLQNLYKMMLDSIKDGNFHELFLKHSNLQIQEYLDSVQDIDKFSRSLDSLLSNDEWGKFNQSILLVKEFQNLNDTSKKVLKSKLSDANASAHNLVACNGIYSFPGLNFVVEAKKNEKMLISKVRSTDIENTSRIVERDSAVDDQKKSGRYKKNDEVQPISDTPLQSFQSCRTQKLWFPKSLLKNSGHAFYQMINKVASLRRSTTSSGSIVIKSRTSFSMCSNSDKGLELKKR
ncbi:hypothetical protein ACO0RG_003491 [Hanseniaspora osmophila]